MKNPTDILLRIPKFAEFLVKKPDFGRKVIDHHVRARVSGKPMIRAIEYAVTYACQATCDKCSAVKMRDDSREKLTHGQVRDLADACYELGNYEANFTGGEPTLAPELEDLISYWHPGSTFIGINTNGALLDRRRILSLREAGADLLKISIDSPEACEHDASRGIPGLYDHIVDVLTMVREIRGIKGHVCMVATRDAVESGAVGRTLDQVKALDATMGIVFPSATGGWSSRHEVLLGPEHRDQLDKLGRDPSVFVQGNLGKGGFLCPCGTREIYISCYGDVIPCPFIQIAFGNVATEDFRSVYRRMSSWKMNERRDVCSSAEDPTFVDRYVEPMNEAVHTPVRYDEHPAWTDGEPSTPAD